MASEQPDAREEEVNQSRLKKLLEEAMTFVKTHPAAKTSSYEMGDRLRGFTINTSTSVGIPVTSSEADLKLLAELRTQDKYKNYQPKESIELVVTVPKKEKNKGDWFNKMERLSTINLRSKEGLKGLVRRPKDQYQVRLVRSTSEIRQRADVRAPGVKWEGGVLHAPTNPEVFHNTDEVTFTVEKGFLRRDKITNIYANHSSVGTKPIYAVHPDWGGGSGQTAHESTGMRTIDHIEQFGRAILGRLPGGNKYSAVEFPKPPLSPAPAAPAPVAK